MKVKLAEALLRRKELHEKVDQLRKVQESDMTEFKVNRVNVADGLDEIKALVPKVTMSEVTAEFDYYSHQLRLCDAAIQQANWTTDIEVDKNAMTAFADK